MCECGWVKVWPLMSRGIDGDRSSTMYSLRKGVNTHKVRLELRGIAHGQAQYNRF